MDQKFPGETETGDRSRERRKETRETQQQSDPKLQVWIWQERQSRGDETPGSRFRGERFGLCCTGRVPASSQVSSGDGGGETGLLQARVPPLLPPQIRGLLVLTQSLPPSGSGPGRSCCLLDSQDSGLPHFSLRRNHPFSHSGETEALAGTWLISYAHFLQSQFRVAQPGAH